MRALEFTRLIEAKVVDPAIQQTLANLQPKAEEDPGILDLVKKAVQKFAQKLKQVGQVEAFESIEILEDELGIRGVNPQLTQQYDNIEIVVQSYLERFGVKMNDPNVKTIRDELLKDLQDIQAKQIKTARRAGIEKGYTAGQRKGEDEFKQWYQSIDQILIRLGKKAQGYTDPTPSELKAMTSAQRSGAKKVGINAEVMVGSTPKEERQRIFKGFEDGIIQIICSVDVLCEGFDSDVRCVIYAKPTKSEMRWVQSCGRACRTPDRIYESYNKYLAKRLELTDTKSP